MTIEITTTYTCKHCGEPIKNDGEYGWVHIANAKLGSWYTYCEMNRNHADHTTSGKLTAAEPNDCMFCGAPLSDDDMPDECSHEEGQGGAAGNL